ncbi:LytTR family DNA-binding domain-containing protein [Octadecabacter sp. 1_MG-2023]|uniref:LytTR family DNA-binding domain-containing protein n=1 Tax=unclassified Octadecabacter TaxID=196158 RepID=UPI001C09D7BF|nr:MULTISPECIES: LytTR family DNA-binding domain-containing protein [unclassified Octadecabacter]MBU2993873.1 LytTR family transcriptional regulator [Octadecabacter sp. B2R22]MDO6735281.1 LytTR family DNA-binding domain-containing protein [Octadecabacter sp. 1_MG-2023]
MAQPTRVASLLGAAIILTVMGPFNTDEAMRHLPRFAYWGTIVVLCYSVGYFGTLTADRLAGPRSGLLPRLLIATPLTGVGVFAVVYILNGLAVEYWATGRDLVIIAANVVVISSIITTIFFVANSSAKQDAVQPAPPPILDRIPFDKRGPLVALSVEDHYVRVRTTKGEDMVLMRLCDAIKEVGDTVGLQVHRSHWIALPQVTAANRKGDGAVLTLTDGPDVPVSRANVGKLKEAGLLPR